METKTDPSFDRVFGWKNNPVRAKLFGKRCRIVHVGSTMRSVLVEFEDGQRLITSRRALR